MSRSSPTKQGSGETRGDEKTEVDAEDLEGDAEERTSRAEETANRSRDPGRLTATLTPILIVRICVK